MKNSLPVTNYERLIPDGMSLVSETDLNGNITSANAGFAEVSGFSLDELIGQPHNIIRHPDVPEAWFEDLWTQLKQGEPWHQYLKNRCKNGDYYWVEANIAPVMQHGQCVGYKSVRTPIDRALIPEVEQSYADVRSGKRILRQSVLTSPWRERFARWNPLPKKSILAQIMIPLVIMAVMWSVLLQLYLQSVADDLYQGAVVERHQILQNNLASEVQGIGAMALTNAVGIASNSAIIYGLHDKQQVVLWQIIQVNYQHYTDTANLEGIGLAVFDANLTLQTSAGAPISLRQLPAKPLTEVVFEQRKGYVRAVVPVPFGEQMLGAVVMSIPLSQIAHMEHASDRLYASMLTEASQSTLISTGEGELDSQWTSLLKGLDMSAMLKSGFTIKDGYLVMLEPINDQQGQSLGAHLVAEPMTILNRVLSDSYFMIYVAQAAMSGGFILLLIQVFGRLKFSILRPLKQMTDKMDFAAENGSLSIRTESLSQDEIGRVGRSFNHYLTSVQHLMVSVSDMMQSISQGQLKQRIDSDSKGDLETLKNQVNDSADQIAKVLGEIQGAIESLKQADYRYQVVGDYKGDYAKMILGLQTAMSDTQGAVKAINRVMQSISKGEFSDRLSLMLSGDLENLKTHINQSLDQLEKGISETVDVVVAQSEGDLTQRITGDYSGKLLVMADAVNSSMNNMANVVSELQVAAFTVSDAANQIATGSSDLSDRIQTQAATLQQTVSSMDAITVVVRKNADRTHRAALLAKDAKHKAQEGSTVMQQALSAMSEMADSSQKIADIIGLIDSIAFQTNLLALNAAVEAARAGEQGRGFAVVAGEVRALAQKSASASSEIRTLIELSVKQVASSQNLVGKTSEEFSRIVDQILQMHSLIGEIANANIAQTDSIEDLNKAIDGMDSVTQQNAALVEETASAADTLRAEAKDMQQQVGFFKIESAVASRQTSPKLNKPKG